ncbi:MAG: dihydropteroate synthase [Actinomycetota bacterium]
MKPRVRILDASTVREVAAALPGIGRTALGCVTGSHPSRVFVVTDLGPEEIARAVAVIEESGGSAAIDGSRLVWSATPQARAAILDRLRQEPVLVAFNGAVSSALARWSEPAHELALPDGRILALGERVHVMGIVNVTPDSFSDGGRFLDHRDAIDHGMRLAGEGADILDVGGESTRPGAAPVSDDEETERVLPVVEALSARSGVPVSIDTTKAAVAKAALDAGVQIVNDVAAGRFDDAMFPLVAERRAPIVLMHMLGEPRTMQKDPRYDDVVGEITAFLEERAEAAIASGVDRERIVVDPGFGFGKTREHNLILLKRLRELRCLGFPVLAGTSRKSFIGATLGDLPVEERLVGTAATVALAIASGAAIVRVHDVREMARAVRMAEAVLSAVEPPKRDG